MMEKFLRLVKALLLFSDAACVYLERGRNGGEECPATSSAAAAAQRDGNRLARDIRTCILELESCVRPGNEPYAATSDKSFDLVQIRHYRQLLADLESSRQFPSAGDTVRSNLALALSQAVSVLSDDSIRGALAAPALSDPSTTTTSADLFESRLLVTTLRWLHELQPGELGLEQLCEGIGICLSQNAKSLEEVQIITEDEMLSVCAGFVRKPADGTGLELVRPSKAISSGTPKSDTRYEIGITCLRMLNMQDFEHMPADYKRGQVAAEKRDLEHPFYRYAAVATTDLELDCQADGFAEQEFRSEAIRLFTHRIGTDHPNLTMWLLEVARQKLDAGYALGPGTTYVRTLQRLRQIDPDIMPARVAACLGFSNVCFTVLSHQVESMGDNTRRKVAADCMHCALVGPTLAVKYVCKASPQLWAVADTFRLDSRLCTAQILAKMAIVPGWGPLRELTLASLEPARYFTEAPHVTLACAALKAYAARSGPEDAKTFLALFPTPWLAEPLFLRTLRNRKIPFQASKPNDKDDPWVLSQKRFLSDLCNGMLDMFWNSEDKAEVVAWTTAWKKGVDYDLICTRPSTRRLGPTDDEAFTRHLVHSMNDWHPSRIRYMMQDARWNANLPLADLPKEDQGRTILHRFVEEGNITMVRLLLDHGASDVSIADASGRTPLHLCAKSKILRLLHGKGADLRRADNDGRLLWHYAAANNDCELLITLAKLDPDKDWVFRQTTRQGRTPLAEALFYVRELAGLPPPSKEQSFGFYYRAMLSVAFILTILAPTVSAESVPLDPADLRSDIPVACLAAEWGNQHMLVARPLFRRFRDFVLTTPEGAKPLHFLNSSATRALVRAINSIPGVEDLPVLNAHGHSPAETIFLNLSREIYHLGENAHPSNVFWLDGDCYEELLTERVCRSRDARGRGLWERFSADVIWPFARALCEYPPFARAVVKAVELLASRGLVAEYESEKDVCAFMEMSHWVYRDVCDRVLLWIGNVLFELLKATTKAEKLRDAPRVLLRLIAPEYEEEVAIHSRIVRRLVEMGVSRSKIMVSDDDW